MNDFPTNSDKFFREEMDSSTGAWLQNPTNKFFLYSEGYKQAGDILYQKTQEKEFNPLFLVYPMIFNYRHYIELRLKELIAMGNKYLGINNDFKDIHDLEKLWNTYAVISSKITEVDPDLINNVGRILKEFNQTDPGFAFRYPVTRGPIRKDAIIMTTVDLKNFKDTIDKLARFLESQWETIEHYQDLKNEY